jgi:pSer/pThr/pTyr-binding forkhead associated (FHA) protein
MKRYSSRLRQFLQRLNIRFTPGNKRVLSGNLETTKSFRVLRIRSQATWYFEVLSGLSSGRHFSVDAPVIRIGRAPENHIQLDDPKISRFHAEICRRGAALFLKDLRSTNGTLLNGERLRKETRLKAGDRVSLGDSIIKLRQSNSTDFQNGSGAIL